MMLLLMMVVVMVTAAAISPLAECLYQHVGENYNASGPENHDAFQEGQRQHVKGVLGDDEPEREKGDTEEMPEQNIWLFDQPT